MRPALAARPAPSRGSTRTEPPRTPIFAFRPIAPSAVPWLRSGSIFGVMRKEGSNAHLVVAFDRLARGGGPGWPADAGPGVVLAGDGPGWSPFPAAASEGQAGGRPRLRIGPGRDPQVRVPRDGPDRVLWRR